jgi:hypothetical protein
MAKRASLRSLDPQTRDEISLYLDEVGGRRSIETDTIPATDLTTLKYWLATKTRIEGKPDASVVRAIGRSGRIRRPVILDVSSDAVVEGRHRLAAAIKYGLPVPVVVLF